MSVSRKRPVRTKKTPHLMKQNARRPADTMTPKQYERAMYSTKVIRRAV